MNQVITMHGWFSDSKYWQQWEEYFQSKGWAWQNTERGYGFIDVSQPTWQEKIKNVNQSKKVVICHSLGIHLLPNSIIKKASHFVFINSFSRFVPLGNESRAVKKALYGMKKHFEEKTENSMLAKFALKAKKTNADISSINMPIQEQISVQGRKKLQNDLDLLINTRELPSKLNKLAQVLVINSDHDAIISHITRAHFLNELKSYFIKEPSHWLIEGEGHFIYLPNLIKNISSWLDSN